jgi:beta-N-acetylglucosaminidase
MENDTLKPAKPRFSEVCQRYNFDSQAMQDIAERAGVPKHVIDTMAVSVAVRRVDALSVLAALGDRTSQEYTLDNVRVALLPTFKDFHNLHQFDLESLSTTSGVSFDLISQMLRDEPVPKKEAMLVLQAASKQTGQLYLLANVDVKTD